MNCMHPSSSDTVRELALVTIEAALWCGPTTCEALELTRTIERIHANGALDGTPAARTMAGAALRLSQLAHIAIDARDLLSDGRDLSWLKDPVLMDDMQRASHCC